MITPLRVLLVGFGRIGQEYAKALGQLGVNFSVLISDFPSSATRVRVAQFPNIGFVKESKIGAQLFDAAILAVPPSANLRISRRLLDAGVKKFLFEKPGALSTSELRLLSDLLSSADAKAWVAYNRRCYSSVLEAKSRIESDGGISSMVMDFTEVMPRDDLSQFTPSELQRWIIYSSSHLFDLVFYLAGRPQRITVESRGFLDWHPAGSAFSAAGLFDGGGVFSFHADWNSRSRWAIELRTAERSLLLRPLEELAESFANFESWKPVELPKLDSGVKTGILEMASAFLTEDVSVLKSIDEQAWLIEFLSTNFYNDI